MRDNVFANKLYQSIYNIFTLQNYIFHIIDNIVDFHCINIFNNSVCKFIRNDKFWVRLYWPILIRTFFSKIT